MEVIFFCTFFACLISWSIQSDFDPIQEDRFVKFKYDDSDFNIPDKNIIKKLNFFTSATEIPLKLFSDFGNLEQLEVNSQNISNLNQFPENGINLKYLDLENNIITEIRADIFVNLRNLDSLYLNNNELNYVDEHAFLGLENLTVLSLKRNKIEKLMRNTLKPLKNLKHLDLGYNLLSNVELFFLPGRVPFLESLNLRNNLLKSANFCQNEIFKSLNELILSNNHITTASLEDCPASTIVLHNNQIELLQIGNVVKNLFVLGNNIKSLVIYNYRENADEVLKHIKYSLNFDEISQIKFLEPNPQHQVFQKFQEVTKFLILSDILTTENWKAMTNYHELIDGKEFSSLEFVRISSDTQF